MTSPWRLTRVQSIREYRHCAMPHCRKLVGKFYLNQDSGTAVCVVCHLNLTKRRNRDEN